MPRAVPRGLKPHRLARRPYDLCRGLLAAQGNAARRGARALRPGKQYQGRARRAAAGKSGARRRCATAPARQRPPAANAAPVGGGRRRLPAEVPGTTPRPARRDDAHGADAAPAQAVRAARPRGRTHTGRSGAARGRARGRGRIRNRRRRRLVVRQRTATPREKR